MRTMTFTKAQQGYTLIEVAIGILVLSVGILGMATMQINAKRLAYDALQRSIATSLSHDIVERMRSNPSALDDYVRDVGDPIGSESINIEPTPDCFSGNTCTPAQLAAHDLWEWEQALDGASEQNNGNAVGGLFSPRACITHTDGVIVVEIAWRGSQSVGNPGGIGCGTGLGLYEAGDANRQMISFTTFIQVND